ncbi:MAG: hypothetical protein M3N16_04720, partial [Actinomycetota bacterium]|nr:hypothetical protein [Actinomycetota bacterium]
MASPDEQPGASRQPTADRASLPATGPGIAEAADDALPRTRPGLAAPDDEDLPRSDDLPPGGNGPATGPGIAEPTAGAEGVRARIAATVEAPAGAVTDAARTLKGRAGEAAESARAAVAQA